MRALSTWLPDAWTEPLRAWRADRRDARDWQAYRRRPVVPPPHVVKVRAVLDHARRFGLEILVETGTFEGEMVRKCLPHFRRIWSIELDRTLAARAARRFSHLPQVRIVPGDSAERLPEVLTEIRGPALFWLDGHYSAGITARGRRDTPLLDELEAIRRHGERRHVILIDDARLLGAGDYPSLEQIRAIAGRIRTGGAVTVADDIVRCTPEG